MVRTWCSCGIFAKIKVHLLFFHTNLTNFFIKIADERYPPDYMGYGGGGGSGGGAGGGVGGDGYGAGVGYRPPYGEFYATIIFIH